MADNFIGEPQAVTLRTMVLRIEHVLISLSLALSVPIKPSGNLGFEWVRCNDLSLNLIAFRALKQPVSETSWSR
jgi:hypothetical protein